jgi:hypothetical protein
MDNKTNPYYVKKEWNKFDIDKIKEIAKNCKGKGDFYINYREEYNFCNREGILKSVLNLIPRKIKWDKESLIEESLRYSSRREWMEKNISSYNTAVKSGYYDECVKHMGGKKKFSPEKKWTFEKCKEIYSKYNNLKDLRKNDNKAILAAYHNGWHKELIKEYIKVPDKKYKWTFEKCKEEALKYNSINELAKKNPTVYVKALREKWLDSIVGHMTKGYKRWTIEKLVEEVSKHPKNQLYKKSGAALMYIKRHKLENQVFKEN